MSSCEDGAPPEILFACAFGNSHTGPFRDECEGLERAGDDRPAPARVNRAI